MANVGYATLQIIPSAKGFSTALNGQVAPGMASVGDSSSKKFGSSFIAGFKRIAGPLAAVAGTAAIGNFLKGSITAASDLNETISKTEVIFKDATKQVIKFSEDSTRNILLTKQEALDAASTFGIFGKSAGLTGKDLGAFSTDLTALASDLSSFYNASTDETITALGAALRGESEPIRRFGVLLDDASLRAEALKQGLVKTTKEALTPQQRVLAAQALILKQTADAQGDAARTSAGFANQQRILRKNFEDIKTEVGSALLPVVTKLTTLIASNLKPAFEALKTIAKPIIDFFKGFGSEGGKANEAAAQFKKTLEAYKNFLAPLVETLRQLGETAKNTLAPAFKSLADVYVNNFLPAVQAILPVLRPIAEFFLKIWGQAVIGALKGAIEFLKGAFKVLSGILNVFAGLFTGDWKKLWQGVKQIFGGLWDAIKGAFKVALNVGILQAFRTAGTILLNIGKAAFEGLKSIVSTALSGTVQLIANLPGLILKALGGLGKLLVQKGKDLLTGFINGIKSQASGLINAIKETITDKLPGFVKKALGIASPSKVFEEIGKNVGLGFIKGVQGSRDKIRDTFAKLAEDIKETGSKKLIGSFKDAQKKILDLAGTRDALRETFKEAKSNLEDLRQTARDYAESISQAIVATANIAEAASFEDIVANLTNSVEQATAFADVIKGLKEAGLNNTSLQQLIEAGPENALASARALLASGQAGVTTINALQAELQKQGDKIGKTISGAVYDAAIADAEKAVTKIGKDLTEVEKQIVSVAAALAREIAKIGKIEAPAWLKDLALYTSLTVGNNRAASPGVSPNVGANSGNGANRTNGNGSTVVVNNYNPVAEPTSVSVSNTLTRLALLEAR